ncbi:MAG: hypothetical protein U0136_12090 [Bdellovibrionota bacterium]
MADVVSAGNFISAVLEHAGYVAQSHILTDFRSFFREAGAFIYLLGAIGGVVSVVIFGSFRAARYLLIGPALYWFLVGPTTPYDGVEWKIGGGTARGLNQTRGDAKSLEDVGAVAADSKQDGVMNVATGFALFAKPINNITNGLADIILDSDEDNEYLLYLGKETAMTYLLQVKPDDSIFQEMLDGDFTRQCSEMFAYGVALSGFMLRNDVINAIGDPNSNAAKRQAFYLEEYNKYKEIRVNPDAATRAVYRAKYGTERVPDVLSCAQMWELVSQYIQDIAKTKADQIIKLAQGDGGDANLACRRILEKLQEGEEDGGGGCDLQNVVARYMLKNTVLDRQYLAQFVRRVMSNSSEPAGIEKGSFVTLSSDPRAKTFTLDEANRAKARAMVQRVHSGQGVFELTPDEEALYVVGAGIIAADAVDDPAEKARIEKEFISVAKLDAIGGPMDAGFLEYPKYHLKNLRQQLFTFALHLPYWQGVLEYLICIAYPFVALVVLLPGRAPSFLSIPMAWLWVKSWDIGFAVVMLFERVLWNILPSLNLSQQATQRGLQNNELFDALSEADKFDHTWNLHMYYVCLAMATMSIPVVTGMATLRARRSILSSFTDKVAGDAKEAGALAAGAHGMRVMADRVRMLGEVQAMAWRAVGAKSGNLSPEGPRGLKLNGRDVGALYGKGYGGDLRAEDAHVYGSMAAAGRAFTTMNSRLAGPVSSALQGETLLGAGRRLTTAVGTNAVELAGAATADYVRAHADVLDTDVKMDRAMMASFHPLLGRYGKLSMMNEAFAAAMDGSGGFELNKADMTPVDDYIDNYTTKVDRMYQYASAVISTGNVSMPLPHQNPVEFARAVETQMQTFGIAPVLDEFGRQTGRPQEFKPVTIDHQMMGKAFGLNDGALREVEAQLNDTDNSFRAAFTYDPNHVLSKLPEYAVRVIQEGRGPEYGLEWSGKDDGKAILHEYRPLFDNKGAERLQQQDLTHPRGEPGIGPTSGVRVLDLTPQGRATAEPVEMAPRDTVGFNAPRGTATAIEPGPQTLDLGGRGPATSIGPSSIAFQPVDVPPSRGAAAIESGPQLQTVSVPSGSSQSEPVEPPRRGVDYKVTDLRHMDMIGKDTAPPQLTLMVQETQDELDAEAQKRREDQARKPVQFIKPTKTV